MKLVMKISSTAIGATHLIRKYIIPNWRAFPFRVPPFVNSSYTSLRFITNPVNITTRKDITSRRTLEESQSNTSKIVLPATLMPLSGPKEREQRIPRPPQTRKTTMHDVRRRIPNFSMRKPTTTSTRETQEVMAATMTVKKNRMAMMVLINGILMLISVKIYGMLWKMRPGPDPGAMPAAKTAGMMATPASSAKSRSEIGVPALVAKIFSSLWT